MHPLVTQQHIDDYARDGAVLVRGLFAGFVDQIAAGIEMNMADPGPYAAENLKPGEGGRFFDDYCNWSRIPPFAEVIRRAPAAEVAA
ncbi:MAG: phytanoyl-CoA dioxygenase, partial [Pseudomonadota bacterium]|nr:phytanoyl-CoA dioxygenase [Pseudomonadota bacterium]